MARVECEHVTRQFAPPLRAVDDVTIAAEDGEILVLVGPSGCGKSTLLRIVAGLETADSGVIRIGGRDVGALSPSDRNVAMVFQDYALYPHMTVRRNLEFPLRVRRLAAAERDAKVARIAGILSLTTLLDRLPKELSGGQRQRVAMGRALVRDPAVSLLDEPLSNLDAKLRSEVRAEIADLQRRTGTTMIYVTHDQVEAMTLGHRVAVMHKGRLMQAAPPAELYDRPANTFVAGFLGTPPMNLLSARPSTVAGSLTLTGTPWTVRIDRARTIGADADPMRTATLGVRPEAISLAAEGDPQSLDAEVEHVELLGHETLVHASLKANVSGERGPTLTARLPGTHALAHGTPLRLVLDPARLHLFTEDGASL